MHQILRQIVEVQVDGSEHVGLEVQRQVSAVCRDTLSTHLEAAFAPFDDDDSHYLIDRLEVDLGGVRLQGLEAALTTSLSRAIATAMRERGITPRNAGARGAGRHPGLSADEALLAGVLYFLGHGRLPWWYADGSAAPLETRLMILLSPAVGDPWEAGTGASLPPLAEAAFVEDLTRALWSDGRARERLLLQFSASCVMALLKVMDADLHGHLLQALNSVSRPSPGSPLWDRFRSGLLEAAVDTLAGAPRHASQRTASDLQLAAVRLAQELSTNEEDLPGRSPGVLVRADLAPGASPPGRLSSGDETVSSDGLLVDDAGVVLLHPFLPRFFEALGVARGDTLVRPARALLLLRHLATGALTAEEHELVLAKVLCGLPIESPVPREGPVTAEEQAEAIALLDSVVRHWSALRNTTADGLRGNFLARRGRIELREGDWGLRVEPRSYDGLLDSLPWGAVHVKLPWMQVLLSVEWAA